MSEGQGDGAELRDNQPDPNLNESHTHSQTLGQCELISLNNNGEEEEEISEEGYRGIKGEEDEENDEMMKEEDTSDESSLIRCQSMDTSTNDSYSETGSLLETPYPISPGTSPEPTSVASLETPYPISSGNTPEPPSQDIPTASLELTNPISAGISPEPTSPVTPVVTLGATYPISPVVQNPCELEVNTHTCITRPIDSTLTITTTGSTCITGPIDSTITTPSAAGSACMSGPACIGTINSNVNLSTDVPCGSGSSCTSTMGPGSSETADCTTGLSASITRQDMTGPTTSTSGPISITVPTATTGTIPSAALLASLQRLGQIGDDIHLPQYLHQIAEACALQEDYQSALCCIHLERLYHQRIIDNINTLQEHWESHCRTLVSDQCSQQLNVLTNICQTHERPSAGHTLCGSLDFRNLSTAEQDRLCGLSSTWIPVRGEIEPAETHTDSSKSSQAVRSFTEEETNRYTEEERRRLHGNQLTDVLESQQIGTAGHATTSVEDHPAHGEMDRPTCEEELQSGERGMAEIEGERLEEVPEEVNYEEEEKQKGGLDSSAHLESAPTQQTMVSENVRSVDDHHGQTQCDEEDCGEEDNGVENMNLLRESSSLDDLAKLITVEQMSPASGLTSILKKRSARVDDVGTSAQSHPRPAKRKVHFNVPDDCFEHDVGGGDSCLLLFLLCFVTVVISVGGTALYCALGDTHSSVCQDFSRNTDFYFSQLQHWFTTGSGSV